MAQTKKRIDYDCENLRYLFDFSLMPSIVFNYGAEFALAVCKSNGELLFDIMQDYYEGLLNDIKRREIRIFDPRRIKANCVKLNNGWCVCCIEMPPDINGSSPVICNAYYIAFKDNMLAKQKAKEQEQENEAETDTDTVASEDEDIVYDDSWYEDGSADEDENNEIDIVNTDEPFTIRFFTVEEATNDENIKKEEIYQGIDFGSRKLCEIFENGSRKEYCKTEKDITVNLVKVGMILKAIDDTSFVEKEKTKQTVVNQETGEIQEFDTITESNANTEAKSSADNIEPPTTSESEPLTQTPVETSVPVSSLTEANNGSTKGTETTKNSGGVECDECDISLPESENEVNSGIDTDDDAEAMEAVDTEGEYADDDNDDFEEEEQGNEAIILKDKRLLINLKHGFVQLPDKEPPSCNDEEEKETGNTVAPEIANAEIKVEVEADAKEQEAETTSADEDDNDFFGYDDYDVPDEDIFAEAEDMFGNNADSDEDDIPPPDSDDDMQ